MNAKFTPGPWHIDEGATTRFVIAVGNDKTGHGWSEIATARDFENARLIAAAPDMIGFIDEARNALKSIRAEISTGPNGEGFDTISTIDALIEDATDVIVKAEGKL